MSLILENVCVLTLFWFSLGGMRGGSGVGTPGQGRERAKPRGSQHGSRLITQSRLFSTFKHQFCLLPPNIVASQEGCVAFTGTTAVMEI